MGCFSGCLMSSAGIQLFCGIYTQRSNVLLMGEKVVSPSYSSAILGPHPMSSSNCCFLTEIIIWFLSFNLLIWCIILIYLHILKNPCIPGINPTWSWCMSFLMCCWIRFAKILLRIFASMFISVILSCSFLFLWCLCLVLVSGWWWPHRMSLEGFLPLKFFERVLEG